MDVFNRFWECTIEYACEATQKRFINHFDYYVSCVVLEAEHRSRGYVPDIDSYLSTRRGTVGVRICFVLLELGMNIPDEAMNHPVIEELYTLALDMIILSDVSIVSSQQLCSVLTRYPGYPIFQQRAGGRTDSQHGDCGYEALQHRHHRRY